MAINAGLFIVFINGQKARFSGIHQYTFVMVLDAPIVEIEKTVFHT